MSNLQEEVALLAKMGYEVKESNLQVINTVDTHQTISNEMSPVFTYEEFRQLQREGLLEKYGFAETVDKLCKVTGLNKGDFAFFEGNYNKAVIYDNGVFQYTLTQLHLMMDFLKNQPKLLEYIEAVHKGVTLELEHYKGYITSKVAIKASQKVKEEIKYADYGLDAIEGSFINLIYILKYSREDINVAVKDKEKLQKIVYGSGDTSNISRIMVHIIKAYEQGDVNYDLDYVYDMWRFAYNTNNTDSLQTGKLLNQLWRDNLKGVIKRRSKLQAITDNQGYIKVYRGARETSNPVDEAISWTLSKNIAASFAYRFPSEVAYTLYEGYIHIDDVYDTFLEDSELSNNEMEILINPKKVRGLKTIEVDATKPMIGNLMMKEIDDDIIGILNIREELEMYDAYSPKYINLFHAVRDRLDDLIDRFNYSTDTELFNCSDIHGRSHTGRVIFHAINLYLEYREEYKLTNKELGVLIVTGLLHDIGRVNDEEDYLHGKQSIEKIEKYKDAVDFNWYNLSKEDIEVVKFLVSYHNIPDDLSREALSKTTFPNKERVWLLYTLFCDADGLDRVRIYDLDISYLRNDKAKLLFGNAQDVLKYLEI